MTSQRDKPRPKDRRPFAQRLSDWRRGPLTLAVWLLALGASGWLFERRSGGKFFSPGELQLQVSARHDGILRDLRVAPGDRVSKGQLLARLDAPLREDSGKTAPRSELRRRSRCRRRPRCRDRERVALVLREAEAVRSDRRVVRCALCKEDRDRSASRASRESEDAAGIVTSRARIKARTLRAPVDGVILRCVVSEGDAVAEGALILVITTAGA